MTYSLRHFQAWEFIPRIIYEKLGDDSLVLIKTILLITADDIREHFGVPVTINDYLSGGDREFRGFRPAYCTVGADASEHRLGGAFDCDIRGVPAAEARKEITANRNKFPYLTRMENNVDWLHCDVKDTGIEGITLFNA
jgi:hypothetical protein